MGDQTLSRMNQRKSEFDSSQSNSPERLVPGATKLPQETHDFLTEEAHVKRVTLSRHLRDILIDYERRKKGNPNLLVAALEMSVSSEETDKEG